MLKKLEELRQMRQRLENKEPALHGSVGGSDKTGTCTEATTNYKPTNYMDSLSSGAPTTPVSAAASSAATSHMDSLSSAAASGATRATAPVALDSSSGKASVASATVTSTTASALVGNTQAVT